MASYKLIPYRIFSDLHCANAFETIYFNKTRTDRLFGLFARIRNLVKSLPTKAIAHISTCTCRYATSSVSTLRKSRNLVVTNRSNTQPYHPCRRRYANKQTSTYSKPLYHILMLFHLRILWNFRPWYHSPFTTPLKYLISLDRVSHPLRISIRRAYATNYMRPCLSLLWVHYQSKATRT